MAACGQFADAESMDEKSMRIIYLSDFDMQRLSAHTNQIYKTISGFCALDHSVILIAPKFKGQYSNLTATQIEEDFGIEANKLIFRLCPFAVGESTSKLVRRFTLLLWFAACLIKIKITALRESTGAIIYSRSYLASMLATIITSGMLVIHEVHNYPLHKYQVGILNKMKVVCISPELANLIKRQLIHKSIIGLHDPADENQPFFQSRSNVREELGMSPDCYYLVYTGKVYKDQIEINQYLKLASKLGSNIKIILVGGLDSVKDYYQKKFEHLKLSNIQITGKLPREQISKYQFAADGLLMYYDSSVKTLRYCSPVKLFEYVATGNVIYGAKSESIYNVLGENAFLIEPDNVEKIAEIIVATVGSELARQKGLAAQKLVQEYSSRSRAKRILEFATGDCSTDSR